MALKIAGGEVGGTLASSRDIPALLGALITAAAAAAAAAFAAAAAAAGEMPTARAPPPAAAVLSAACSPERPAMDGCGSSITKRGCASNTAPQHCNPDSTEDT